MPVSTSCSTYIFFYGFSFSFRHLAKTFCKICRNFPWCCKSCFSYLHFFLCYEYYTCPSCVSRSFTSFHALWSSSTWQSLSKTSHSPLKHFTFLCRLLSGDSSFPCWPFWITGFHDYNFPIMLSCWCHLLLWECSGVMSGSGLAVKYLVNVLWVISPGYPECPCGVKLLHTTILIENEH